MGLSLSDGTQKRDAARSRQASGLLFAAGVMILSSS